MLPDIVLGFILPGVVAYRAGVFAEGTMKVLVFNQFPDAKNAMATFERTQAELRAKMSRIDQLLLDNPSTGIANRPALIAERAIYDNQLQRAQPPISIQPFYQHIIMYFWPIMFSCLAAIALVALSAERISASPRRSREVLPATVGIFLLNAGPTAVRNAMLSDASAGRIVYAYSNVDVSATSFAVQLLMYLLFALLLALVWSAWSDYAVARQQALSCCWELAPIRHRL